MTRTMKKSMNLSWTRRVIEAQIKLKRSRAAARIPKPLPLQVGARVSACFVVGVDELRVTCVGISRISIAQSVRTTASEFHCEYGIARVVSRLTPPRRRLVA